MTTNKLLEKRFLLGNVMQIAVLTHADAFKDGDIEQYLDLVKQGAEFADSVLKPLYRSGDVKGATMQKGRVKLLGGYKKAWEKIKKEKWQNVFDFKGLDGGTIPESVAIAVQEELMAGDPSICLILASTVMAGGLIQKFGRDVSIKKLGKKLLDCELCGSLALFDADNTHQMEMPRSVAVPLEDGSCSVTGMKEQVIAGDHDLSENIVYLVTARIETGKGGGGKATLLAVPRFLEDNGKLIDNGVRVEGLQSTMGLKSAPCVRLSFGADGESRGFPLELPVEEFSDVNQLLTGWYAQLALQSVVHTGKAVSDLFDYGDGFQTDGIKSADEFSARITPAMTFLKAVDEGLRGALYMSAFYNDCLQHGAESQKAYFSDLFSLYSSLFMTYAPTRALEAIFKALHHAGGIAFNPEYAMEQSLRDLQTSMLIGRDENIMADFLLNKVLPRDNGRILQQLLKQFESVDSHLVMSETLNETVAIWQDYIGGLIVLFDDIMKGQQEPEARISPLFSGHILKLFGDVILCYHLIVQGMEAERVLVEGEANFYNLRQEVANKPELKKWYNKLLLAEYFAVHVLSMQESTIRLIQRNPQAVLEPI